MGLHSVPPIKSPAPPERPGHGTGGCDSHAHRSVRHQLAAVMRDLRHEQAAAFPELAEWIDFLDLEGKSPKTLYSYTRELALLLREYPDVPFAEISHEQINHVLTMKPVRSRYITRSVMNGWFEWGMLMDKIDRSPMRKVAKPRYPKRRPSEIYDEAEIAKLEALPSPDGPLCTLMFTTGLRKAECRHLRRSDINVERKRLVVLEGKGGKTRIIPLPDETVLAVIELDLHEQLEPDDHLWGIRPGGGHKLSRATPVSDTTFDRWWSGDPERGKPGVCAKAEVRRLNIHQTRHTYARRLKERGVPVDIAKVLLGHESIRTTDDQYGRNTVEDAASVIAEMWTGALPGQANF